MELSPKTKILELIKTLKIVNGKTRQEFMTDIIVAMIEGRTVHYSQLAHQIETESKLSSVERRIERFFKEVVIDYFSLTALLLSFVHHDNLVITIDRTEWDFGELKINVLCAAVSVGKLAVPLYFEMLDNNSGNSNYADRIQLFENIINVIGADRIDYVAMDREFIGVNWLSWLTQQNISFCIRVPENHNVTLPSGEIDTPRALINGKRKLYKNNVLVDGVKVNLSISYDNNGELLYLIGTDSASKLREKYKRRWSIEVFFQAIKERSFNIESTRIKTFERLRKLFAIVCIAYTVCWAIGIEMGRKKGVKAKKHGYPQHSVFRRGWDLIRCILKRRLEFTIITNVVNIAKERIMNTFEKLVG